MKSRHELISDAIFDLDAAITPEVFKFNFNRHQAEIYLKENPSIPFIIRPSSINGYFVFTYLKAEKPQHWLMILSAEDNPQLKLCSLQGGIINIENLIIPQIKLVWDDFQKKQKKWQQLKENLECISVKKMSVMSIHNLDNKLIALEAKELESYEQKNEGLEKFGDGHTGFAMAKVLDAPFIVMRSAGNREQCNQVLKNHMEHNGLIVITGHGSAGGVAIRGNYNNLTPVFFEQRARSPAEIVNSILEAGLKKGNHINILLCICFGACDPYSERSSFAEQLAKELVQFGISSTIIATDMPFLRFGLGVIKANTLNFSKQAGMAAEHVHVFSTQIVDSIAVTDLYKPYENIQLSRKGMRFLTPKQLMQLNQQEEIKLSSVINVIDSNPLFQNLPKKLPISRQQNKNLVMD